MIVKVTAGSKESLRDIVQEIMKTLAFRCLTIEEANNVLDEVKRQMEGIPAMDVYKKIYPDSLPKT